MPRSWARAISSGSTPMWNEIAAGAKRSVASNASSSNGRIVWLIANGLSVRSRSARHCASSSGTGARRGAERTESACLADRRRELDLVPRPERGAQDRDVDPEQVAQRGAQHDPIIVGSASMPQAFFEQHDDVGELVLDAPPLNLFCPRCSTTSRRRSSRRRRLRRGR